jgi:hypothetical protein
MAETTGIRLTGTKLIWLSLNKEGVIDNITVFYTDGEPRIIIDPFEIERAWNALRELGVVRGTENVNNEGMAAKAPG